jgi:hypothetical protein
VTGARSSSSSTDSRSATGPPCRGPVAGGAHPFVSGLPRLRPAARDNRHQRHRHHRRRGHRPGRPAQQRLRPPRRTARIRPAVGSRRPGPNRRRKPRRPGGVDLPQLSGDDRRVAAGDRPQAAGVAPRDRPISGDLCKTRAQESCRAGQWYLRKKSPRVGALAAFQQDNSCLSDCGLSHGPRCVQCLHCCDRFGSGHAVGVSVGDGDVGDHLFAGRRGVGAD